ncbi:ABC transporter permease [Natronospora cellulosivora (SeqCode)]
MGKYFSKKFAIYLLTFFVAITINWAAPRFMPGDPISQLLGRFALREGGYEIMYSRFAQLFGFEQPLIQQYFGFWRSIFSRDLGISIMYFPRPVFDIIREAIKYDIYILVPAITLSWVIGNKLGAFSGMNKTADNVLMPVFYFLTSSPYFWFAVVLLYLFGTRWGIFPVGGGAYSATMRPGFHLAYFIDFLRYWFLPFFSLFLVQLGGWAIGMRNMILYEKSSNYSKYMKSLGASKKLIRSYGFRNGVLPQVTGLALQFGNIMGGAIMVQMVFSYPGIGYRMLQGVMNQDYFLIQGTFLFSIILVLVANFIVDIIYMIIDPRVRLSYSEEV